MCRRTGRGRGRPRGWPGLRRPAAARRCGSVPCPPRRPRLRRGCGWWGIWPVRSRTRWRPWTRGLRPHGQGRPGRRRRGRDRTCHPEHARRGAVRGLGRGLAHPGPAVRLLAVASAVTGALAGSSRRTPPARSRTGSSPGCAPPWTTPPARTEPLQPASSWTDRKLTKPPTVNERFQPHADTW